MDNSTFQKINDLIAKNDKIGIALGIDPTLDEMAAALSLYLSLTEIGKSVSIASATQPIVELSSLVGIDKVTPTLDGVGGDLVVSFPYEDKQIEKVSYNLDEENHQLHIIVKAGENGLQFDDRDVQFRRSGGVPQVLFVIGTPRLSDLSAIADQESLDAATIINIDNKQDNEGFGSIVLVSPEFSSVSEQVGNLLAVLDLPIEQDTAQNLLSGLAYATDNFQSQNTSYVAFEMAAMLMRKGAQRQVVQRPTRETTDMQQRLTQQLQSLRTNRQANGVAQPQRQTASAPSRPMPQPRVQTQQRANVATQRPSYGQQRSAQAPQQSAQQSIEDRRAQLQQQLAEEARRAQQTEAAQPQEPVQDFTDQNQTEQPIEEPPSDWLEPKVYKGSTPL